jgi:hypothetical protein
MGVTALDAHKMPGDVLLPCFPSTQFSFSLQRRPQITIANHQITAAQAMQMVLERHSQQVRRMNFVITHTGTSALCTTTKSKPDAATAVILHKRKRGRT